MHKGYQSDGPVPLLLLSTESTESTGLMQPKSFPMKKRGSRGTRKTWG